MTRTIRTYIAVTILAIALVLVGGCTPAATPTAEPTTPAGTTPTQGEVKPSGTVSVCIDIQAKTIFNQFIARFEEKFPDIEINALYGKDQNALIAANQAPDLLKTGDLYVVSQKDLFADLTAYIERDKAAFKPEDFYPNAYNSLNVDGKQLALPSFFNVGLLYYNKTLFDESGIAYPTADWTQEDFISAAQALTKMEGDKVVQWGSSTVLGWWGEWLIHVRQAGGDWMVDGKCALDTPEAIAGLDFFFQRTTKGQYKFAPSPTDDALGGFAGGKTAMEYGGHTGLWVSYNAISGFNWDIAVLPKGLKTNVGAEFAVDAYGMYKESKNPDATWEFLKFWTGTEGAELMSDMGRPAARMSVAETVKAIPMEERANPKSIEALFDAVATGLTLPTDPNFINCTQQVVQPYIDKMLEGKLTAAEAATEATIKANEYLEANK